MSGEPARYPWRFGLPLALYYSSLGIFQGYTVKFFQYRGIASDSLQMMFLMAAAPMVALMAQPLWGRLGDRLRWRNTALFIMIGSAALLMALLPVSPAFPWLMAVSCLFAAFFTPIQPMGDSIILEALQPQRASFGPVRLIGSLGYAFTNLLLAGFFQGRAHLVPWVVSLGLLLLMLSALVLPKTPGHQRGRLKVPLSRILRLPHMVPLLALMTALMLAIGFFYSYYTIHFTSLRGGTMSLLGLSYFISSVAELPFLLLSQRLYRRFGTGRLMAVSAGVLTVRFLIMGFAKDASWLLFSQVLHGGSFVVIMVSMALYINQTVPDEIKAGGQMLLSVLGFGAARVFGTFFGGIISRRAGGTAGGFLAMAGVCFAVLLAAAPYFFRRPPINGLTSAKASRDA